MHKNHKELDEQVIKENIGRCNCNAPHYPKPEIIETKNKCIINCTMCGRIVSANSWREASIKWEHTKTLPSKSRFKEKDLN